MKTPAGVAETTITLALRQATQEAAQKAKDMKKKVTEVLLNTSKPESREKSESRVPTTTFNEKHMFETITILQNPDNSTWSAKPRYDPRASRGESTIKVESVQPPTSTGWRQKDIDPPILMHRGSSASSGSAEEIKKIEDEETIPEEDEN